MLLEFGVQNYKSFKNNTVFSLRAGKDNDLGYNIICYDKFNILKSAVIYGGNGSGKSNFVNALAFMKSMVVTSINHQPGAVILQQPHKLLGSSIPTKYYIQFTKNSRRYAFGFSIINGLVTEEYLYHFPNGRQAKIYERINDEIEAAVKYKSKLNPAREVLKANKLFLSCAASFSSVDVIGEAYSFFSEDLVICMPQDQINWMNYSLNKILEDENIKKTVLELCKALNIGIVDIKISKEQHILKENELPPQVTEFMSDKFKSIIFNADHEQIKAKLVYEKFETDLMQEESTGVQKLFAFMCPWLDIIQSGKVLVWDELETNLHEHLVRELLKFFYRFKSDKCSQLIFTTHDTSLLDLDIFRRDQIWFTEMSTVDRSTDMYSLAELKNVRKDESFGKGYITGRYGAIPMLNMELVDQLLRKG